MSILEDGRAPQWWPWPQRSRLVQDFSWQPGHTPCSRLAVVIAIVIGYLTVILLLQKLLKTHKTAVPLGPLPAVHNLILCAGSLIMFLGALQATIVDSHENGWLWGSQSNYSWVLCFPVGTKAAGRVFFWSYVYYLSKFYELLDTLILVLRKKPLSVLHVYHHCLVVFMCFLWLEGRQSLQVIGLLANTGIHVVMYFYYFMHSIGMPPPWKKFVTNSQIVQFLFSFVASIPFIWLHFKGPGCEGFSAWLFNIVFNLTLLILFFDFHRKQYSSKSKTTQKHRKAE